MKIRDALVLLGFRSKPETYGYAVHTFCLPKDGQIEYAQWLHPHERKKVISQESVDELRKFLFPGDVAIDIGAHSGDSAIPMALAVGKSGYVIALEPNPYVFSVLKKNSELNSEKTNIIALMIAATPADNDYEFEYSDAGFCNGGRHQGISKWKHGHAFKLRVEGRNLQSLLSKEWQQLIPRIRFIKIDAEGYDFTILQTISELIGRYKPFLKVEVFKRASREQRLKLFQFLTGHGYTVYRVESDSDYRGQPIQEADLTRWRHYDVFCVPG